MISSPEICQCPLVDEGASIVNSPVCNGIILFMMLIESYMKGRCDIASPCNRIVSEKNPEPEYDFIVVGSGASGAVVASRLSEVDNFKVLLIEAGGPEPIGSRIPSFYRTFWFNELVDWRYRTVPSNYCLDQEGQGCMYPRGKVLGGSTLLNGMMYHRGHKADYEDWEKAGAQGWSWDENLPYFDMTEGNKQIGSLVSYKYHSASGPMPVQMFNYQPRAVDELVNAIYESGLPIITDMNDPSTPDGFSIAQTFNENGQRITTSRAFLRAKWERPNLSVLLHSHVSKVILDGKRAVGVEYIDTKGNKKTVRASKEVILSAGALNTPQILLLSGVGPRETLRKFNIPVVEDLPVGKNFRNHYGATLYFMLTKLNNTQALDWNVFSEYILRRTGPMSSTALTQVTGILYSSLADKKRRQPDIQIFFNGFYAECSKTGRIGEPSGPCPTNGVNVSANAAALLPRSVGYITLNSTDPLDPPLFYPEYFSHPHDMIMIKDAIKYLKMIFDTDILQNKYGIKLDPEYTKQCANTGQEWSDKWMECMARVHTDAQNHQIGTAAIGHVVDPDLMVYNIKGLRVIDASVMPTQTSGNPQGTIMMVAERGAAKIKEKWMEKNARISNLGQSKAMYQKLRVGPYGPYDTEVTITSDTNVKKSVHKLEILSKMTKMRSRS
ncbi:glucose dehydrogenase [FAD, quinone]-like isoform X2 [Galleria mellonella]|nr:glucose dehydrogenase [FAD, quinone]-like isoform X2 [Galleria mellonella]XP_031764421.2 glucose dehydrogenase [FAD, quinone]-like isoform X2 [Galleria mellonella]